MYLNIFSDLRKPGLVPGKSLSPSTKIGFCFREKSNLPVSQTLSSIQNLMKEKSISISMCTKHLFNNAISTIYEFKYILSIIVTSVQYKFDFTAV